MKVTEGQQRSLKKRSSLRFDLEFCYVPLRIVEISKKKKSLHFDLISNFAMFLPESLRSLKKKKRSSLRFDPKFRYVPPRIVEISKKIKKKKEGLHFDLISNFAMFLPESL